MLVLRPAGILARISASANGPPVDEPRTIRGWSAGSGTGLVGGPGEVRLGRPRRRLADQLADHVELAEQRRRAGELAPRAEDRGVHRVERAVAHRLVDLADVPADRGGHHQDRTRPFVHDPPRGLDAVHHRHEQVHEDDVGPLAPRHRHRLLAVAWQSTPPPAPAPTGPPAAAPRRP